MSDSFEQARPATSTSVPFLEYVRTKTLGNAQDRARFRGDRFHAGSGGESEALRREPGAARHSAPSGSRSRTTGMCRSGMRAGIDNEWFSPYEAYYVNRFRAPREANNLLEGRLRS